jgi:predicted HNH restriction endonuclease
MRMSDANYEDQENSSWKQQVADLFINLVNSKGSASIWLQEFYDVAVPILQKRYPANNTVRDSIRRNLQELRKDGFIRFDGVKKGLYHLSFANPELRFDNATSLEQGVEVPEFHRVVRNIRLRDTVLAIDLKRKYKNTCQVCHHSLPLTNSTYAEAHHIKPLGRPHCGPDIEGNIIVVCPNHHVMFDRAALFIDPSTMKVHHRRQQIGPFDLLLYDWHQLDRGMIEYAASLAPIC